MCVCGNSLIGRECISPNAISTLVTATFPGSIKSFGDVVGRERETTTWECQVQWCAHEWRSAPVNWWQFGSPPDKHHSMIDRLFFDCSLFLPLSRVGYRTYCMCVVNETKPFCFFFGFLIGAQVNASQAEPSALSQQTQNFPFDSVSICLGHSLVRTQVSIDRTV